MIGGCAKMGCGSVAFCMLMICCLICIFAAELAHQSGSSSQASFEASQRLSEWKLLTKGNFSTDIRKHRFVLCVATVPWCGESRSLMKQIVSSMEASLEFWSLLHLRSVYINVEKDLGLTLAVKVTPTFIFYRNAIPYRYEGKLNAHNILAGVWHGVTTSSIDLPLKRLDTLSACEKFVDSTDKAVILFDICKWSEKLSQNRKRKIVKAHTIQDVSSIQNDLGQFENDTLDKALYVSCNQTLGCNQEVQDTTTNGHTCTTLGGQSASPAETLQDSLALGKIHGASQGMQESDAESHMEMNKFPLSSSVSIEKHSSWTSSPVSSIERGLEKEEEEMYSPLGCESGVSSFMGQHFGFASSINASSMMEANDTRSNGIMHSHAGNGSMNQQLDNELFCSWESYQQFEDFYRNFIKIARVNVLTPEKANYGLVTDHSLVQKLGLMAMQNYSWFLMMQSPDALDAPKFFFGDHNLEEFLSSSPQLVLELEGVRSNYPSTLLNDTPSVILFIDRASPSVEVQEKSKESLQAIRAVAQHYMALKQFESENIMSGKEKHTKTEKVLTKQLFPNTKTQLRVHILDSSQLMEILRLQPQSSFVRVPDNIFSEAVFSSNKERGLMGSMDSDHLQAVVKMMLEGTAEENTVSGSSDSFVDSYSSNPPDTDLSREIKSVHLSGASKKMLSGDRTSGSEQEVQNTGQSSMILEDLTGGPLESYEDLLCRNPSDSATTTAGVEDLSEMTQIEGLLRMQNENLKLLSDLPVDVLANSSGHSNQSLEYDGFELEGMPKTGARGGTPSVIDDIKMPVGELSNRIGESCKVGKCNELPQEDENGLPVVNAVGSGSEELGTIDTDYPETLDPRDGVLSFFFVDGDDRLKQKLEMTTAMPSVVILDLEQQERYVFPFHLSISKSSLLDFVDQFQRGVLRGEIHSESPPPPPRKLPQPPFVNRDFHELDAVPRVTMDTFSHLVLGLSAMENLASLEHLTKAFDGSKEELGIAWKRDVLVLFTIPWCGFCKRMELVLREAYRSVEKYRNWFFVQSEFSKLNAEMDFHYAWLHGKMSMDDNESDLPVLLQMDCSANDCSQLFKPLLKEDAYPMLVLFPAGRKGFPVKFDAGPTVHGIFKFLAQHGSCPNSLYAIQEHIWNRARISKHCSSRSASESVQIESTVEEVRPWYHFTLESLSEHSPSQAAQDSSPSLKSSQHPIVGSVLVATEKLMNVSPDFENSIILIVKADKNEGFQGLIVNKPLPWKNLSGLDSKLEPLLKTTLLYYGGPVISQGMPFLSLTCVEDHEGFSEVISGVYFGESTVTNQVFESIMDSRLEVRKFLFFLGHAIWGWQQLLDELAANFWQLSNYNKDLIQWPVHCRDDVTCGESKVMPFNS